MPKAPTTPRDSTSAPALGVRSALGVAGARVALLALAALTALASSPSCRNAQSEVGLPEASLSASADAQANFRTLRAAWFSGSTNERRKLEANLRSFLVRFPSEEPSDMVRVLLAFDCVSRGSLQEARVLIAQVRVSLGAVHDFSRVAEAYALLRESKADEALLVLEPLAGKIVDSDERLLFSELRLRAAASARRYVLAVQAAVALLTEADTTYGQEAANLDATCGESTKRQPQVFRFPMHVAQLRQYFAEADKNQTAMRASKPHKTGPLMCSHKYCRKCQGRNEKQRIPKMNRQHHHTAQRLIACHVPQLDQQSPKDRFVHQQNR